MRTKVKFNEGWLFSKEAQNVESLDLSKFASVSVPHTWNNLDGQDGGNDYYRGTCWYKKDFELTSADLESELYLEFEAIEATAVVYINNKEVCTHIGGFSTFRIHLNEYVQEGLNTIVLSADNDKSETVYPQQADFTFYGGIYRDVNLIKVNKTHFDLDYYGAPGVKVTPVLNEDGTATVEVEAYITNPQGLTVRFEVDGEVKEVKDSEAKATFEMSNPHLWNGRIDPYLYVLKATILDGEEVIDNLEVNFGVRSFRVDPETGFYLNGKPYHLHGVSRHQDRKDLGWAITEKEHEEDMKLIAEVGATTIRLAHYQHAQYFYDLCDKYGMIIWAEIPYISRHMDDGKENVFSQMKELIVQNYNHPSIVCWGLSNEITMNGETPRLIEDHKELNEFVHNMDKTRLTTIANVTMTSMDSELCKIPDIISYNHYFGWYAGKVSQNGPWLDKFHKKHPNICIGLSEYGCECVLDWHTETPKQGDYSEEYQCYYHEEMLKTFAVRPFIWSTHVWNMFDFAADARDEGGVKGMNNKGLVTYDRKTKKDSFYLYKAYWNQDEKFVWIASKRFKERELDVIKVGVYTNLDEVTLTQNGEVVGTVEVKDHKATFEVKLVDGENTFVATSGECKDEAVFVKVESNNNKYVCPNAASDSVTNWFDDTGKEVKLNLPEGYLNVNVPICDYVESPLAKQIAVTALGFAKSSGKVALLADYEPLELLEIMSMSVTRILNLAGNMVKGLPDNTLELINEILNKIPAKEVEEVKDNLVKVNVKGKEVELNLPEGYYNVNSKIKHLVKAPFVKSILDTLVVLDTKKKISQMLKGVKFFFIKQFKVSTLLKVAIKKDPEILLVQVNDILNKIKK